MKTNTTNNRISLKGDRDLWIDFVAAVKKQKKEVWEALEPYLQEYIKRKR